MQTKRKKSPEFVAGSCEQTKMAKKIQFTQNEGILDLVASRITR